MSDPIFLLTLTLGVVGLLILMVVRLRLSAFIALTLASLFLGAGAVGRDRRDPLPRCNAGQIPR